MTHGERIRQARELRGWTQAELADKLGVAQAAVAQFEGGLIQPQRSTLESLCFQTGFPIAYFERPPLESFSQGTLLFRARGKMTTRECKQVYSAALLAYEAFEILACQVKRSGHRVPRCTVSSAEDIEKAAALARSSMGLSPDAPLNSVALSLERAGVRVLGLWQEMPHRDAFSLWAGSDLEIPVIALFPERPGDRIRFSLAHELGHLVMHQTFNAQKIPKSLRELEREADHFAGAFLMPQESILPELGTRPTLTHFVGLKARWRVSIQALVIRAHRLGVLSQRQVKYLYQQLQRRGWRQAEPVSIPREKPRAFRKTAEMSYGVPIDLKRMSKDVGLLRAPMLEAMLSAHSTQAELAQL